MIRIHNAWLLRRFGFREHYGRSVVADWRLWLFWFIAYQFNVRMYRLLGDPTKWYKCNANKKIRNRLFPL